MSDANPLLSTIKNIRKANNCSKTLITHSVRAEKRIRINKNN